MYRATSYETYSLHVVPSVSIQIDKRVIIYDSEKLAPKGEMMSINE